jgi:hypothetical protein
VRDRWEAFFTWVWRINGLVVLAVGLLALVATGAIVLEGIWSSARRERHGPVRVAGSELDGEELRLSGFEPIAGSRSLYATLLAPDEYASSPIGSSGGLRAARNVLFFDTDTRTARWLFADHDQEIADLSFLKDPPGRAWDGGAASQEGQRALALLLEVGPVHPERDRPPARAIAVAAPDGRGLRTIVPASEGLIGHHQTAPDTAFVFYTAEGAVRVLELDPLAREVRSDATLSGDRQP